MRGEPPAKHVNDTRIHWENDVRIDTIGFDNVILNDREELTYLDLGVWARRKDKPDLEAYAAEVQAYVRSLFRGTHEI